MTNRLYGRGFSPLFVVVSLIILMIIMPSMAVVVRLFEPVTESWIHIKTYLLRDYMINSFLLIVAVGFITGVIGVYFSWMLSRYKWPYQRVLEILMFLPMAIPPYIAGYVYGGILTPFGTLYRLMDQMGLQPIKIDIMSIGGAVFVFSLFLMPYVLLVTRSFFNRFPVNLEEASLLLGKGPVKTFFRIVLPMSRGAIIGGVVLVILEVLNDYGLVKYFGIPTFSTAIYTTWFGMSDVGGAVRLAASLMVIVGAVLMLEQFARGRGRLSQSRAIADRVKSVEASTGHKVHFYAITSIYLILSLVIPVGQLVSWALLATDTVVMRGFAKTVSNTLLLSLGVTVIVVVCGVLIGNLNRLRRDLISKFYARIVILGYSIPASIIAIAVLVLFTTVDRSLGGIYNVIGLRKLFLTGSIVMLVFALVIRFMAIGFNNIESGFSKIGTKYYEASKLLGKGEWATFVRVDLPMLKPAILSGMILTFVEVLKELPLTLILRPFNFDTLATRVFTYAGDEMIHEASIYALMIIAVSVAVFIGLSKLRKEPAND